MLPIQIKDISRFVNLQRKLTLEFSRHYSESKDLRWLLDFPGSGEMNIDGDKWRFVKHGAGLRFTRESGEPCIVVDIHDRFDEPNVIDEWRLQQFFESLDVSLTDGELSRLIDEMCSLGMLTTMANGQYHYDEK